LSVDDQPTGDGVRAERILHAMKQTINHDLPNAMVALKGMMQLLLAEESERLSPAGRDYLQRLGGISQRLQMTVITLRALNRTGLAAALPEKVAIQDLIREAGIAARAGIAGRLYFHWGGIHCHHVKAPRPLLYQAVLELLQLLGETVAGREFHFHVFSEVVSQEIELGIGNCSAEVGNNNSAATLPFPVLTAAVAPIRAEAFNLAGPEQRLRLLLVEELAHNWGGTLAIRSVPGHGLAVTLTFPETGRSDPA
jgi:signal transduction histidine kinase